MFTGLIEEIGQVTGVSPISGGLRISIAASHIMEDLGVGDSISVNGVCLTVVKYGTGEIQVEAVGETLEKTTLKQIDYGHYVNLERAMRGDGRFGGHFVQGHVNNTGIITDWHARGENYYLEVELPAELMPFVIPEGSIAIEGISLTVAALVGNRIGVNIIPHTARVTNLQYKNIGDRVNIEIDMIARYVANLLKYKTS